MSERRALAKPISFVILALQNSVLEENKANNRPSCPASIFTMSLIAWSSTSQKDIILSLFRIFVVLFRFFFNVFLNLNLYHLAMFAFQNDLIKCCYAYSHSFPVAIEYLSWIELANCCTLRKREDESWVNAVERALWHAKLPSSVTSPRQIAQSEKKWNTD